MYEKHYKKQITEVHQLVVDNSAIQQGSGDFQCPSTGQICEIFWNPEDGIMWAEAKEEVLDEDEGEVILEDTFKWCLNFIKFGIFSCDEANTILSKCLFNEETLTSYFR